MSRQITQTGRLLIVGYIVVVAALVLFATIITGSWQQ